MENINDVVERVLVSEEEIRACVKKMAEEISKDYKGKCPLFVSALSGSYVFTADLMRELTIEGQVAFIFVSSYDTGTVSSGTVEITSGKGFDPVGRDIIILEDIIDSGRTLNKLRQYLVDQGAASVEICTLLDKPSRRVVDVDVKYCGFQIPDEFVIGYGLDFGYKYRQFPFVGVLKREYYE